MPASGITALFLTALSAVNYSTYFDFLAFDTINHDKVRARDDQFSGALPARLSEMWEVR